MTNATPPEKPVATGTGTAAKPSTTALDKVLAEYAEGKATKEQVTEELGKVKVEPSEGQSEEQAKMERLLEVLGPDKYNEFTHA